ncbi:hypothetical protein [Vulcanisaeta distributa]|uniref:hypothetical protein n=1 Tax=Vulcanisaeta distributa TaxID=164451 RepID=UPI0006D020B1|nr:hypothetical protein [Vulcanisaeta distributa]
MRKGLLITGGALIVLGIAIFFIGIYLSSGITSGVEALVTGGVRNETLVPPNSSITIAVPENGAAIMIIYNDTLGKPLQVVTSGPGQLETENVEGQYVVVYVPETSPGTLSMVNNYSESVMVYYTYGTINVNTLMPFVLSSIVSIGLVIAGVVLLILGAVLKSK